MRSTEAVGAGAMRVLGAAGRAVLGMITRGASLDCCAERKGIITAQQVIFATKRRSIRRGDESDGGMVRAMGHWRVKHAELGTLRQTVQDGNVSRKIGAFADEMGAAGVFPATIRRVPLHSPCQFLGKGACSRSYGCFCISIIARISGFFAA